MEEIVKDDAFISLFSGKIAVLGNDTCWRETYNWLKHGSDGKRVIVRKKLATCLQLFIQPPEYLSQGETRSGKGDKKKIDAALLKFMPKLSASNKGDVVDGSRRTDLFKDVNFAMAHRVALIALQIFGKDWSWTKGWVVKYGGKPSEITKDDILMACNAANFDEGQENNAGETAEILWKKIKAFQDQKVYWKSFEWAELIVPGENATESTAEAPKTGPNRGKKQG
jgi:hypothetical protein